MEEEIFRLWFKERKSLFSVRVKS